VFDFIQELTESRMFRNQSTLKGKSAETLASVAFLSVMMIEIMRVIDPNYARRYAKETLSYENFTAMRNSASDLHNILTVLNNQTDYEDKITANARISVPVLQLRRYLRDIENGRKDQALDRQLFKTLEDFLSIKNSVYKKIRRNVGDWQLNSEAEKTNIRRTIKNELNQLSLQLDILQHFKTIQTHH